MRKKGIVYSFAVMFWVGLTQAADKPNFILVLTDDHGWSSLSAPMDLSRPEAVSDYHQTPNMDALLDMGMRFADGYAASPVCSPTRYSIQFGKSPARLHLTRVLGGNKANHDQVGIPHLLKSVDPEYRCAHFGKWHINEDPARYGYDEHDGRTKNKEGGFSNSNHKKEWGGYAEEDPKRVHSLTDRAIEFMQRSIAEDRPFFVQLSHYAVHSDLVYSSESFQTVASWRRGKLHKNESYAAMMRDLDESIGTLLEAHGSMGLAENTYLIFLADNGGMPVLPIQVNEGRPYRAGLNTPLLRGKWDLTEGGIRVPFAITGPGIEPGSQSDVPVISYDLLPTIADLAGVAEADLPANLDGGSLQPLFSNPGGEVQRPFEGLVFHFPHYNIVGLFEPHSAIRVGDHKLLRFYSSERSLLFNVADDIGESMDISSEQAERTTQLEVLLADYLKQVEAERPENSSSWAKGKSGEVKTKFLRRYSD